MQAYTKCNTISTTLTFKKPVEFYRKIINTNTLRPLCPKFIIIKILCLDYLLFFPMLGSFILFNVISKVFIQN